MIFIYLPSLPSGIILIFHRLGRQFTAYQLINLYIFKKTFWRIKLIGTIEIKMYIICFE